MSLDSFANLKTEIANWLARSDITSSSDIITTAISMFEAEINRDLRLEQMRTVDSSLSTVASTETVLLPSDFLQLIDVFIQSDPSALKKDTEINMRARYTRTQVGRPKTYCLYPGSKILFAPVPDGAYDLTILYYAKLTALSDANTTNWLLDYAPQFYLYGTLRHLMNYVIDPDRKQMINEEYVKEITAIDTAEGKKRSSGAGMQPHVIGMVP